MIDDSVGSQDLVSQIHPAVGRISTRVVELDHQFQSVVHHWGYSTILKVQKIFSQLPRSWLIREDC